MPSKRTNDSVERILEELSHQQARDGVRDSVNDTAAPGTSQEYLGPIGKEDLPRVEVSGGMAEDRFSTAVLDDLLGDLPSMKFLKKKTPSSTQSAPQARPAQQRPARQEQPARQAAPAPQAQPVQQRPARQEQPARQAAPAPQTQPVQQHPV